MIAARIRASPSIIQYHTPKSRKLASHITITSFSKTPTPDCGRDTMIYTTSATLMTNRTVTQARKTTATRRTHTLRPINHKISMEIEKTIGTQNSRPDATISKARNCASVLCRKTNGNDNVLESIKSWRVMRMTTIIIPKVTASNLRRAWCGVFILCTPFIKICGNRYKYTFPHPG